MTANECRSLVQTTFDEEEFERLLSLDAFRHEFLRVASVVAAERCFAHGASMLWRSRRREETGVSLGLEVRGE